MPGKIGLIKTSAKYVTNRAFLEKLLSSSQLPKNIAEKLKQFNDVIEQNSVLMIEVLNEELSIDSKNIFENDSYSSPYYGAVSVAYWAKFNDLRPKAEQVSGAIRTYLKID